MEKQKIYELLTNEIKQGIVKIDEPMDRNSLDYYKNEKDFVVNELAVTAYFPKNAYSVRREIIINKNNVRQYLTACKTKRGGEVSKNIGAIF